MIRRSLATALALLALVHVGLAFSTSADAKLLGGFSGKAFRAPLNSPSSTLMIRWFEGHLLGRLPAYSALKT